MTNPWIHACTHGWGNGGSRYRLIHFLMCPNGTSLMVEPLKLCLGLRVKAIIRGPTLSEKKSLRLAITRVFWLGVYRVPTPEGRSRTLQSILWCCFLLCRTSQSFRRELRSQSQQSSTRLVHKGGCAVATARRMRTSSIPQAPDAKLPPAQGHLGL